MYLNFRIWIKLVISQVSQYWNVGWFYMSQMIVKSNSNSKFYLFFRLFSSLLLCYDNFKQHIIERRKICLKCQLWWLDTFGIIEYYFSYISFSLFIYKEDIDRLAQLHPSLKVTHKQYFLLPLCFRVQMTIFLVFYSNRYLQQSTIRY